MVRNKTFSFINILGLSIGMAATLAILLWVRDERSWDKFQQNYEQTWRVLANRNFNGEIVTDPSMPIPVADALEKSFPQVDAAAFTSFDEQHVLRVGEKILKLRALRVSAHYFDIFEWDFIRGTAANALTIPDAVVLTESAAMSMFGTIEAIDKVLRLDNQFDVKVTAVIRNPPSNSSQQFDFITPYNFGQEQMQDWVNSYTALYVKLQPGASTETVEKEMNKMIQARINDANSHFIMHPMKKWRLYSDFQNGENTGGMISYVRLFTSIAIVILLIACINFMNLSTARSERRAKEVGIRKTLGSARGQLMGQFFMESILLALLAFLLSLLMLYLLLPAFNVLVNKEMSLDLTEGSFWVVAGAIILFTGIFAGSYPAIYLSGFNPVRVLKGTIAAGKSSVLPRKVLVVGQFVISIVLISATLIIFRQIQYVKSRDLGYNPNNLVSVPASPESVASFDVIRNELLKSGQFAALTRTSSPITDIWNYTPAPDYEGKPSEGNMIVTAMRIADDFSKTTGVKMLQGRDFSGLPADSAHMLLNQAAVKVMGLKNPVGMRMRHNGRDYTVLGVTDDLVMGSPFRPVDPMMMLYGRSFGGFFNLRLTDNARPQVALQIQESTFKKYSPSQPFEYQFIDQQFGNKFATEDLISRLANIFAGLAIFICCLGLSGLTAFTVQRRVREIGIRKVLGASVNQLLMLLSREFLWLVFIALLIAIPIAWYGMHQWLQQYAYRASIEFWQFVMSGVAIMLLTLLVVSLNAVRAARMKPSTSLRTE